MAAADFSIDRLQRLDEGEWAKLRAAYHDRIYAYVKRQVNHLDWAEDLAQEVFLEAIRGIGGFDRRYNVEQYLMGISRNKVIDFLRRKRPEVNIADRDEDSSRFFNNAPGGTRRPSQIQSAKETVLRQKDALIGALKDMVADLRKKGEFTKFMAIELTFLTDWKHRKIAERLSIDDEKSIAGIKFRAIRDLQQRLKKVDSRRTLFSDLLEERVKDCPEIKELARLVETGESDPETAAHVRDCDACRTACETLEDEVMSLQISISELWFREEVSCFDDATLRAFAASKLDKEMRDYVQFHLQDLDCARCQAAVGAAENEVSAETMTRVTRSKARADDASVRLLGDLKKSSRK